MKTPLPHSIADLLNGAASPPPVAPVEIYDLEIPTQSPDARTRWKEARRWERLERANRRAAEDDIPF